MKSFLLTMSLIAALGTTPAAQAATPQPVATLGLAQSLGGTHLTVALNTVSPESTPTRSTLPVSATPTIETTPREASGFELESGLVLALAGVMALLVVSRRRIPR